MEEKDKENFGLKTIIVNYLLQWRVFLVAFIISLIPALIYLFVYPRTYSMMALIQVQEDRDMGGGNFGLGEAAGLMKSFGIGGITPSAVNLDDEMMILTSNDLIKKMVLDLGVNVDYKKPFSFYRLYDTNSPFKLTADSITNARLEEKLEFSVNLNNGNVKVKTKSKITGKKQFDFSSLPATIQLQQGTFVLDYSNASELPSSAKMNIIFKPAGWVAEDLAEEFLIEESSKTSNVVELSCTDYEKERGVDMLNTLIRRYNEQASDYKMKDAYKTLNFLDGRINGVTMDLAEVENKIEDYKNANRLMDIEHDVQLYVEQMRELQVKIIEFEVQAHVVKNMEDFVNDPDNKYNLVPTLLTSPDGENSPIASYNAILLERARVIQNSSITNPLVTTYTEQADKLRESVVLTIANAKKAIQASIDDLKKKEQFIIDKMYSYPSQERQFIELKRQQEIFQGVYLVLLQKREETALVIGQDKEKARVLDYAYVKARPVGPRKLFAAIFMLAFTLIVPVVYLFCKEQYKSLKQAYKEAK